jgi:hypothetical protein
METTVSARASTQMAIAGPTTAVGLLGREMSDEGILSLTRAPAYIARQDLGGGDARYAVVLGESLGRRGLMDLLFAIAPYKAHGPDRFSRVLDNWGIFDRAKTNGASDNLFRQHAKSLKSHWEVFGEHRDLYVAIFEDVSEATRAVPILTWEKSAGGVRKWRLEAPDPSLVSVVEERLQVRGQAETEGKVQLDTLLGLVVIPYLLPELRKNWQAWQPLVKDGKSNYIGPASMFVVASRHRRALLNSVLIEKAEEYIEGDEES